MKVMISTSSGHRRHESGADPTVMVWQIILRMIKTMIHKDKGLHKVWREESEFKFLPMLLTYAEHLNRSRSKAKARKMLERFVEDGAMLVPNGIKAAYRDQRFSDVSKIADQDEVEEKHSLHKRIVGYAPEFVASLLDEELGREEKASKIVEELYELVRLEAQQF